MIKELKHNLLGLPAIKELQLLKQIDHISLNHSSIINKYPKLFSGLETFKKDFEITIRPEAKPFAICTPRKVPLPLCQKVQNQLACMESLGIISKVDIPTPWCAGMVVVPKKDKTVRICVNLKPLNQSLLCETHPFPKVDDTLAQCRSVLKARCQYRFLADSISREIASSHYLSNTIWSLLFLF